MQVNILDREQRFASWKHEIELWDTGGEELYQHLTHFTVMPGWYVFVVNGALTDWDERCRWCKMLISRRQGGSPIKCICVREQY